MICNISEQAKDFIKQYEESYQIANNEEIKSKDEVKKKVRELLQSNENTGMPYRNIKKLETELYYLSEFSDKKYRQYHRILRIITCITNGPDYVIKFDNERWKDIIICILSNTEHFVSCMKIVEEYETLGKYALDLEKIGCIITIAKDELKIQNPEVIEKILIEKISKVSIFKYYAYLLSHLIYHQATHTFKYKYNTYIHNELHPYQYLINLSMYCAPGGEDNQDERIKEVFSLAMQYTSIRFPVTNVIPIFKPSKDEVLSQRYLQSFVNECNYYTIKQNSAKFVSQFVRYISANITQHVKLRNADFTALVEICDACELSSETLLAEVPPEIVEMLCVLPECSELVHELGAVPEGKLPRPILKIDGKHYFLPTPIAAGLLYRAFIAIIEMRSIDCNERGKLGVLYEFFIKSIIKSYGIASYSGNYSGSVVKKDEAGNKLQIQLCGECDLLIDLPHVILLVEIKKRVLSESSGYFDNVDAIIALSDSLLKSTYQNMRTEYYLNTFGEISLKNTDTGAKNSIKLAGRPIVKISLSNGDYGTMQGSQSSQNLVMSFLGYKYVLKWPHPDDANSPYAKQLQRLFDKLAETQNAVSDFLTKYEVDINLDLMCFLSFERFLYIFSHAHDIKGDDYCSVLENVFMRAGNIHASNSPLFDLHVAMEFANRMPNQPRFNFVIATPPLDI